MMKKLLFLFFLSALFLSGCGDKEESSFKEGVVSTSGCGAITEDYLSEVSESFGFNWNEEDLVSEVIESFGEDTGLTQLLALYQCRDKFDSPPLRNISQEEKNEFLLAYWKHLNYLNIEVTPEETKSYYEEHIEDFTFPASASTRHLFLSFDSKDKEEVKNLVDEIYQKLKEGVPFGDLILKYSQSSSVEQGGYLGLHTQGELLKEYEDFAYLLEPGEIGEPLLTDQGYHIIQLLEKTPSLKQPFEEVEKDIESLLQEKKYLEKIEKSLKEIPAYVLKESKIEKWTPDWKDDEILWKAGSQQYLVSNFKKDWSNYGAKGMEGVQTFLKKKYRDGLLTEIAKLSLLKKTDEWEKEMLFLKTRDWCNDFLKSEFKKELENNADTKNQLKKYFEENSFVFEFPTIVIGDKIRIGITLSSVGKITPSKSEILALMEKMEEEPLEKVAPEMKITSWYTQPFREELSDFKTDEKSMLQTALESNSQSDLLEEGAILGPFFSPDGWILITVKELIPPNPLDFDSSLTELFSPNWKAPRTEILKEILVRELKQLDFKNYLD